jgi:hypothetical protein
LVTTVDAPRGVRLLLIVTVYINSNDFFEIAHLPAQLPICSN